jgi:hypothetical protein
MSADFGQALAAMRKGAQVRRDEWGADVRIYIHKVADTTGAIMRTERGGKTHWTPTSADLLATDWEIL